MAGKQFLENPPFHYANTLGVNISANCSILQHFRDKCIFAFYVEIQDGHQK